MASSGVFKLPPNTQFGATVLTNAALQQVVTVSVNGAVVASFQGAGTQDRNLGTRLANSGPNGVVTVTVMANGKPSDVCAGQITMGPKMNMNFGLLGAEDGSDMDYNDAILLLNWPLG